MRASELRPGALRRVELLGEAWVLFRDDAQRVLLKNFPDTDYLKPRGHRKNVPWWRIWDPDW